MDMRMRTQRGERGVAGDASNGMPEMAGNGKAGGSNSGEDSTGSNYQALSQVIKPRNTKKKSTTIVSSSDEDSSVDVTIEVVSDKADASEVLNKENIHEKKKSKPKKLYTSVKDALPQKRVINKKKK